MDTPSHSATAPIYDAEPAQRRLLGTVTVDRTTWWSGELIVPESPNRVAFLALRRHGPPSVADDAIDATILLRELPALKGLLANLMKYPEG